MLGRGLVGSVEEVLSEAKGRAEDVLVVPPPSGFCFSDVPDRGFGGEHEITAGLTVRC